jgi:hypothetical protein
MTQKTLTSQTALAYAYGRNLPKTSPILGKNSFFAAGFVCLLRTALILLAAWGGSIVIRNTTLILCDLSGHTPPAWTEAQHGGITKPLR